jgi:hypothetical protein
VINGGVLGKPFSAENTRPFAARKITHPFAKLANGWVISHE